jgi:hypothetical protein
MHYFFLFDSCFSGTVFQAKERPKIPRQIDQAAKFPVRQFITAGSADETVPANSVFTPADALRFGWGDMNKDGYVTGLELGLYLWNQVPQHTVQTPQYGKIRDYELARGDFVFVSGTQKQTPSVSVFPDAPQSKAPDWVCNPSVAAGTRVAAVGSGKSSNSVLRQAKCEANARSSMLQKLEVSVKAMLQQYAENSSSVAEKLAMLNKATTEQLEQAILHSASPKRYVTSPKGTYYCLIVMEKEESEVIVEALDKAERAEAEAAAEEAILKEKERALLWQKFMAGQVMEELEREIEEGHQEHQ